jgi:hypothetical protein
VDASFAIHADMRSHYGYMIFFGSNENSPIFAKSVKLKAINRSSTEVEISFVNELASELYWVIDLQCTTKKADTHIFLEQLLQLALDYNYNL